MVKQTLNLLRRQASCQVCAKILAKVLAKIMAKIVTKTKQMQLHKLDGSSLAYPTPATGPASPASGSDE